MKIHHLNCGTLQPKLVRTEAIVYCLLIEGQEGFVLVDTGFGLGDYERPTRRMRFFMNWMGVPEDPSQTAHSQIIERGYQPSDVRHILLTHLHCDHAGGLRDFPQAEVHLHRRELEAALRPRSLMERAYEPAHWAHGPRWRTHERADGEWFGFKSITVLEDPVFEIRLIPLPGHTRGHCGVAIGREGGWILHAGDSISPFHPASNVHARKDASYPLAFFPTWLVHRSLGPHLPRIRKLIREPPMRSSSSARMIFSGGGITSGRPSARPFRSDYRLCGSPEVRRSEQVHVVRYPRWGFFTDS